LASLLLCQNINKNIIIVVVTAVAAAADDDVFEITLRAS
jgi:hypothetical protein